MAKDSKKKVKRFSISIGFLLLLIFFGFKYASGTPYQTSLTHLPAANARGLSAIDGVPGNVSFSGNTMWREWREHRFAKLRNRIWLFSKVFEFAPAEKSSIDLVSESMGANAASEPPTMLLFAFALIGMASIGRKKFLKK